jgi:predicted CXXCH cytochrome family protein
MKHRVLNIVFFAALAAVILAAPSVALAFDETTSTIPPFSEANCGYCHEPYLSIGSGVHGNYATTTTKCEECHSVHAAPAAGTKLLPAATITATCNTCHDGTQGGGVYGAIAARGLNVAAKHSTETTNVVPGGDASTGGSKTMSFSGSAGTLTCTDCHSPHGSEIVTAFPGDRQRITGMPPFTLTKMLKQKPGGTATATANYGSDWCLSCHQGRSSALSAVHNHPTESKATTSVPFTYNRAAISTTDAVSSTTTYGAIGGTNRGYLMVYPRTAQQSGHLPICQQCHEDNRYVGELVGTGTQSDPATWTGSTNDGKTATNNPRFGTFPHETTGYRMLVEATATVYYDDLCLNCHPVSQLP